MFMTYRVPNPQIEVAERKIVTQTAPDDSPQFRRCLGLLQETAVSRSSRSSFPSRPAARSSPGSATTTRRRIAGLADLKLSDSMTVRKWVGDFKPDDIKVIPLVEDMEHLLLDRLAGEGICGIVPTKELRVFIARSDPALNYGLIPAVLLAKIALSKLHAFAARTG